MNLQRAAQIQVVLEGIDLPATRDELIRYAAGEDRDAAAALEQIARGVARQHQLGGEHDAGAFGLGGSRLPQPESGKPPGGADYLRPFPESGAVRPSAPPTNPPKKTIEQQTKTQKRQQQNQS